MARIKNKDGNPSSVASIFNYLRILLFIFVFAFVFFDASWMSLFQKDGENQVADGFTIDGYDIVLDVSENNVISVNESIDVNWYEGGHHGIYKFIPEWLEYTGKDGKTLKRKSIVSNLVAIGEPFSLDDVKNGKKKRIKIGDPYSLVDVGLHNYNIGYTYDMGSDPFKNGDEFIFHAFGDYWGTPIKKANIQIRMPKNIEGNNINFFFDKYRKESANDFVTYTINGNIIDIGFDSLEYEGKLIDKYCYQGSKYVDSNGKCNLPDGVGRDGITKSLTIDLELPEGYFVSGSNNYGKNSLVICIVIILLTLLTFYRWLRHGKDVQKASQTVEFYAPDNYDPAEIGYIYGKQTGKKLAISLIVSLAAKGYIRIDEADDKKSRTIVNLLPSSNSQNSMRLIKASKLKDCDNSLSLVDIEWMNNLFKRGDLKYITDDFDNFYKKSDNLIRLGYIKCEDNNSNNEQDLQKKVNIEDLKPLTETEKIVYDMLFSNGTLSKTVLSVDTEFYKVFGKVSNNLEERLEDKLDDHVSKKKMVLTFVSLIICIILWALSYFYYQDLNPKYSILYYASLISLPIMAFFGIIMERKTEYGELITARVLGFKNYLLTAEKGQLESQVEKNPNYFYEILPYAYVLGVSKKWIENFENIPIPENTMGNFDYNDTNSFDSLYDSIHFPESVSSSSSGGGCSSCGGGCSSCGGGCSSCGGGGSW